MASGVVDENDKIQDTIVDVLEKEDRPVKQGELQEKLQKRVGASPRKFKRALKGLIEAGAVRKRRSGKRVMYSKSEDGDREAEMQMASIAEEVDKMVKEFPGYPTQLRYAVLDSAEQLLSLRAGARSQVLGEDFDDIADDGYGAIRKRVLESVSSGEGPNLLDGEKIVVKTSVEATVRKAFDRGRDLHDKLRAEYVETKKGMDKISGGTKRRAAARRIGAIEGLEATITQLARRMEQDVSRAVGEAESAEKMRDGKQMGPSPHDDDVRGSDYGMTMAMLDYEEELDGLCGKFERHLRPVHGDEMIAKIEAVRAAMKDARDCAYRMHAESLSGTGSGAYKAAEKMKEGAAYCAIAWAVCDGRLKEPFSAREAEKHAGEVGVPDLADRSAKGARKLFEKEGKKYKIARKPSASYARNAAVADAVWA